MKVSLQERMVFLSVVYTHNASEKLTIELAEVVLWEKGRKNGSVSLDMLLIRSKSLRPNSHLE